MALRAIWSAWNDGTNLSFRGDFYPHTLMTPFFSPPPARAGRLVSSWPPSGRP